MTHALPSDDWYRERLAEPSARPHVIIDTDAANEIDDQFALAWALQSPERLQVDAVYAAPYSFAHRRASLPHARADARPFDPPGIGMQHSHDEILKMFALADVASEGRVFEGSARYLASRTRPIESPAVDHLVRTARAWSAPEPLYVVALGCVTNIASALLIAPDIASRIVVVWTSGYPSHAPQVNDSFNLEQDLIASQVLLDSGVPHVYLPGYHVGAQLRLSLAEMERYVQGQGAVGDYLHHLFTHNPLWDIYEVDRSQPYSWVIWDLICLAWLIDARWVPSGFVRTPVLDSRRCWQAAPGRHLMREGHAVQRDAIFNDFFATLARHGA